MCRSCRSLRRARSNQAAHTVTPGEASVRRLAPMTSAFSRRAFLHAGVALALQSAATLARGTPAGQRDAIVHRLARALRENYHDEAFGGRLADAVLNNLKTRAYDETSMSDA